MTEGDERDGLDELFGGIDSPEQSTRPSGRRRASEPSAPSSGRRRAPEQFGADELAAPPPGSPPERPTWVPSAQPPPPSGVSPTSGGTPPAVTTPGVSPTGRGSPWTIPADSPSSGTPAWSAPAHPGPGPTGAGTDPLAPPTGLSPGPPPNYPAGPTASQHGGVPPAYGAPPAGPAYGAPPAGPAYGVPGGGPPVPPPSYPPPPPDPGLAPPVAPAAPSWEVPPSSTPAAGPPQPPMAPPDWSPGTPVAPAGPAFDLPVPTDRPAGVTDPGESGTLRGAGSDPNQGAVGGWSLGGDEADVATTARPVVGPGEATTQRPVVPETQLPVVPETQLPVVPGSAPYRPVPPDPGGRAEYGADPGRTSVIADAGRTAVLVPTAPLLPSPDPVDIVEQDDLAKSTVFEKVSLVTAVLVPPVGLIMSIVAAVRGARRRGWVIRVSAVAIVLGVIGSILTGFGGVALWNQYQLALEHGRLEAASAQFCATLTRNPELAEAPLVGWPPTGRSIPDSLASMQEFVDRWTAVASVAPQEIAPGAQAIADAGTQVYGSVEIARRIDDEANRQVIASAASASGVPDWYQEYCVLEP